MTAETGPPSTARRASRYLTWLPEFAAPGARRLLAWQALADSVGNGLGMGVLTLYLVGPAGLSDGQVAVGFGWEADPSGLRHPCRALAPGRVGGCGGRRPAGGCRPRTRRARGRQPTPQPRRPRRDRETESVMAVVAPPQHPRGVDGRHRRPQDQERRRPHVQEHHPHGAVEHRRPPPRGQQGVRRGGDVHDVVHGCRGRGQAGPRLRLYWVVRVESVSSMD